MATKSDNLKGMLWMLVATAIFSLMHVIIRHVSANIPPMEIVFFRNLFGIITIFPLLYRYGFDLLKTRKTFLLGTRAVANSIAMITYFTALALSPLADVTALGFSAPIFATVLAVIFFNEIVRLRRWLAIGLGFLGTLIILRPGFAEIDFGMMMVLLSALTWAITLHLIKMLSKTESSLTITAYMVLMMTPITFIPALYVWVWPGLEDFAWLVVIGIFGTLAQLAMTEGMKLGDINVVMPVDFLRLIWIAILAWIIFGEIPVIYTWIGGALIFSSATYIAIREHRTEKKPR